MKSARAPLTIKKYLYLLPRSMAAQMVVVILLALFAAQCMTTLVLYRAHKANFYLSAKGQLISNTIRLTDTLAESPSSMHSAMLEAASSPVAEYSISFRPLLPKRTRRNSATEHIEHTLGTSFHHKVRVKISSIDPLQKLQKICVLDPITSIEKCQRLEQSSKKNTDFVTISIQLPNHTWLNLMATIPAMLPLAAKTTLTFLTIASVLILLAIIFMVRRITRPLRALSNASNRLGRGENVEPLVETGPDDIQRAIRAFNRMNERLKRFVVDRTNMIAAISHDLRTPITTLRLRVELLPDALEKQQLLATLDEMQQMVEATLTFARENAANEPSRKLNIDALLDSICEDLMAIGMDVTYTEGPPGIISICRPISLRRALRNLIENAVKYGHHAHVTFTCDRDHISIIIEDEGPGIKEADQERIFEPFVRLENSRSRETGGMGLGMAIARNIIHGHGGKIGLRNRAQGGLQITVTLPL